MADVLLGTVFPNLQSVVKDQLATYWGVDQHSQKLSSHLIVIRVVLRDAERKQITSHAVKDWLQKLTDAAYVLDDILDECSLQSKKVHSDEGRSSCLARVHPKDILFRFHIGKRMKDITQRFHYINEERSMFELRDGVTEKQAINDDDDWRQTSSVITEPIFCGRDEDREKIVKFLLKDASKSEDLSIYPIVGSVEVEEVGNNVWRKLYHRSFFQEAKCDDFGIITSFKMHDLFCDLAKSIMGEECVIIEKGRLTQLSTRVHHLHVLNSDVSVDMAAFKKFESLQTFLDFGNIGELPSNHYLRALRTTSSLLSPLNDLAHLRYLSACGSSVASLLNSICQLPKLQILKLEDVHHLRLPRELTQLQNLRHIVIDENCDVEEMPPNISKLRNLRTLSNFVVGSKAGCGLAELHSLKLGGTLRIEGLENVPNEWDAKQANLIGKKDLNILHLSWGGSANSEGSNVNIERILEALQPPSSLKSFEMKGYKGRQLSNWIRNGAFLRDLVEVILLDCNNCEELPPLGKLPQLKRLYVRGMENVKWIDGESYGVEEKAFPSLEKLPKLERMLREEGVEMLPRLSQLTIDGISNLKFPRLPSVQELRATDIDKATSLMEGIVEKMPCLKTLKIERIKGQVVLPDQLSVLGALQELDIGYWYNLEYFSEHVLEGLTSLQILNIYQCEKLKSLSEGVRHLTCLEILIINHCPELVALPSNISQLTALWSVSIVDCSTLPYGLQCVPSLRTFHIIGLRFTSLPDWLGDMTSLQNLEFISSSLVSSRLVVVCVVSSRLFITRGDVGDGLGWLLEGLLVETLGVDIVEDVQVKLHTRLPSLSADPSTEPEFYSNVKAAPAPPTNSAPSIHLYWIWLYTPRITNDPI
ncbi:hypothetical protein VNO80_09062 [Phaseolus coccineus]|uniref:Rx N-terminal domain-containing protein n=1 Tax=Phaseolus coccineus TaxID=3886 RepID=A0AAN9RC51_PHACN